MSSEKKAAVHVPPGEGETVWLLGDTYTLKISGEQTGGAFTLLEAVVPLGGGPPPHIHHLEDEVFVILEGELRVTVAGRTLPAPVGTVISVPKGAQHSYAAARSVRRRNRASRPRQPLRRMLPSSSRLPRSTTLRLCHRRRDNRLYSSECVEGLFCEVHLQNPA